MHALRLPSHAATSIARPASLAKLPTGKSMAQQHRMVKASAWTLETAVDPYFMATNSALAYLWAPLLIAPRWEVTKAVYKSDAATILLGVAYMYYFVAATLIDNPSWDQFNQKSTFLFTEAVTDPRKMATLFTPAYVAQDWLHLGAWDFLVARYVWLEALEKDLPVRHSLIATFMFGPGGLLVAVLTKYVVGAWRQLRPATEVAQDK